MNIDYEAARFWLAVLNLVGTMAVGVYTFIATRDKDLAKSFKSLHDKTAESFKELEDKIEPLLSDHNSRLDRIETTIEHMPSQDEISELQGDMKAVKASQEATRQQIDQMRMSLNRIEDFLLRAK